MIAVTYSAVGYLIDPHTAVAKYVADKNHFGTEVPLVISSTAHFSKFSDGILDAFGIHAGTDNPRELMKKALDLTEKPEIHKNLWEDVQLPRHHKTVSYSFMWGQTTPQLIFPVSTNNPPFRDKGYRILDTPKVAVYYIIISIITVIITVISVVYHCRYASQNKNQSEKTSKISWASFMN